jgi:hypothetical protein
MSAAADNYVFGGVDARSNPLNIPVGRAIRCQNFTPRKNGILRLRYGYKALGMSAVTPTPIHSMVDYYKWNDTQYLMYGQGTNVKRRQSDGTITTIKAGLASAAKWNFYRANNNIYFGNGTDMLWYDGVTVRPNGIPALTAAQVAGVSIVEGVREPLAAEATPVVNTIGAAASGAFPATVSSGRQFYLLYFDPAYNELGMSRSIGTRATTATIGYKYALTVLPNISASFPTWLKLVARTEDGGSAAFLCATQATQAATMLIAAGVATVTQAGHGYATGDVVMVSASSTMKVNGPKSITVIGVNTYTFAVDAPNNAVVTPVTTQKLLSVAAATTTLDVTGTNVDTTVTAAERRGFTISVIATDTPGYQFYAALWRRDGGGHVGNRIAIGGRNIPTYAVNYRITGIVDPGTIDPEYTIVIGSTVDGAKIPYAVSDTNLNWLFVDAGYTRVIANLSTFDFNAQLPDRNGVIPSSNKFARVGSRIFCNADLSPYIFFSAAEDDQNRQTVMGVAVQSWAENDFETFPTSEKVSCMAESSGELMVFARHAVALLTEVSGIMSWRGPWHGIGCAGQRAFVNTPYGPFWITSTRQVATKGDSGPKIVSGEYEKALLKKIGAAYLSEVECVYALDPEKEIDEVIIKFRDSSASHTSLSTIST